MGGGTPTSIHDQSPILIFQEVFSEKIGKYLTSGKRFVKMSVTKKATARFRFHGDMGLEMIFDNLVL